MVTFNTKPVSRSSLSKQIAEQLKQAIIDGTLRDNERLPTEETLADQYNVSRPTIREALKSLSAQKLIKTRRGPTGGSFINQPSISELSDSLASCTMLMVSLDKFSVQEINQMRRLLEQACSKLAAFNRNDEDLSKIRKALSEQEALTLTAQDFCLADVAFYRAIVEATGNRMLSFIMSSVLESMQSINKIVNYRFNQRQQILSENRQLLDAIEQGDPERAVHLISQKIDYIELSEQEIADTTENTLHQDLQPS